MSAGTHKPAEAVHQQIAEPQSQLSLIIQDLRAQHSLATPGMWTRGSTSHQTVSERQGHEPYHVADFRHANDAAFCDLAHRHVPTLLDELERQHARIAELEAQAASSQPEDSVCAPSSGKITVAELTQEKLKNFLTYDQETGVFTINSTKKKIGRVGFRGYLTVDVYGTAFRAHRLAWLYMTGTWPKALIDHIDGDVLNNRFSNLREATHSQNVFNAHSKKRNRNLPRGVQKTKGSSTFRAEISDAGKKIHLGCYPSAEEASEVYQLAAEMLHGEFAYHLRDAALAAQAKQGENQCTSARES